MTKEQVLEEFDKGYDCCQVVFRYWAEKLNMDTELAYKVSSGFGAGMFQGTYLYKSGELLMDQRRSLKELNLLDYFP